MSHNTLILGIPLLGAVAVGLFGARASRARWVALAASLSSMLVIPTLWVPFNPDTAGYQLVETAVWIPSLGASYVLGLDALGLWFVVLTTFLTPLAVLGSWGGVDRGARGYYSALLVLETGLLGVFLAIDVLLFYIFWGVSLFCLGLLILFAGGRDSARAALRFWTLTLGSSLLLLIVFAMCHHIHYLQSGAPSFDARHWLDLVLHPHAEAWLFWLSFTAFGLLVPLMPLQFWLQSSVPEASIAARIFICAVLVKVGVLGLFRFVVPWFPRAAQDNAPIILTLAVVSVLYGAVALLFESDLVRILARVTAIYMGLAVFGLFTFETDGVKGSILLMLSHGILIATWFLWIGMLEKRTWSGQVPELIGLKSAMPVGTGVLTLLSAATIGVPAFGTFIGLCLVGRASLASATSVQIRALGAGFALLLVALFFLKIAHKAIAGKGERERNDLGGREALALLSLLLLIVWMGIQPAHILQQVDSATDSFISRVPKVRLLTE